MGRERAVGAPAASMARGAATAAGVGGWGWRTATTTGAAWRWLGQAVDLIVGRAGEERWRTRWRCRGGARIAADLLVFVSSLFV